MRGAWGQPRPPLLVGPLLTLCLFFQQPTSCAPRSKSVMLRWYPRPHLKNSSSTHICARLSAGPHQGARGVHPALPRAIYAQHAHPADARGAGRLRRARLCHLQRRCG
eukprot:130393-Chlamydomonas_euryale.AAC.1